jgi:hypothetical protein
MLELLSPVSAALGVGEDLGDRAAVLALQPGEQGESLLDLLQRPPPPPPPPSPPPSASRSSR